MAGKIKALQQWCRKMAEGYPGVDIGNFTTAWRDGLAFCAIIHRFRPDLIDFDSLSSENVFENCQMAFEIAEKELSIPAFLEAEDMVRLKVPDKLSIITYVSQYYNYLHALPQLGGPGVTSKVSGKIVAGIKRPTEFDSTQGPITKKATTVETKENAAPAKVAVAAGADICGICHDHVYLIERHMEDGKLYHRSCFRRSELSPANKVYSRSPFMSPSLSSEALKFSKAENKNNVLSKADRDGLVTNLQRHMDNQPIKVESDTKISRKLDIVGSKHSIDELGREDTKKSKMQPRNLFDNDNNEKAFSQKDQSADNSNKPLPLSSKEAHKLEKRQEYIFPEKPLKEQPGTTLNMSVFSQQKNQATREIPTALAVSVPAKNTSQTKSENILPSSKISVATLSLQPLLESSQSKSKHIVDKEGQKLSKETEKSTIGKTIQKSSDKNNVDTTTLKSNLLPDIHNLQKLFSGKPSSDNAESATPRAKPRSSTVMSDNQASNKNTMASKPNESIMATPKPVPRNSLLSISGTTSAPKQPEISSQVKKSGLETEVSGKSAASKPLAVGVSLLNSKNAQSHISAPTTSSAFDKTYQASSTETKISFTVKAADEPKNVAVINQPFSLQQKIATSKMSQNSIDVKSTDKGVLNVSNAKKPTEPASAAMTRSKSNQKFSSDQEQTAVDNTVPRKDKNSRTTPSLSATTSNSSVHTTQAPTKLQSSASLSQVQSENKSTSSFTNPTSKTVNSTPTSSRNPLVSQTQTAHTSAGVGDSAKFIANTNGTQSSKNIEKAAGTQVSKDSSKTVVSTARLQTSNKVQEALNVFSSGKPMNGEVGISFTNSARGDVQLTRPQKVNESSSKPTPPLSTDIHSKEKPTSSNLLHLKDTQQKLTVKNSQTDSKRTNKNESKSLSSIKNSAVSGSKEDLLDINNVQLKRVMPEQKYTHNEQRTSMYDIKLKKVDVIKGDANWASSSQKPLGSIDIKEASLGHKSTGSHPSNGDIKEASLGYKSTGSHPSNGDINDVSSSKSVDSKAPVLSSVVSSSHTATPQKLTPAMPQWKKDAEERQRKLRENVVNPEPKTDNMKQLKQNDKDSTPSKYNNNPGLASSGKAGKSEHVSVGVLSLLKTPSESLSTKRDSSKALAAQKNGNKIAQTAEDSGAHKKLDWQLEAEKRMAAIADFDKRIVGKLKGTEKSETVSSDVAGSHQVQKNIGGHKTDISKDNKNSDGNIFNGFTITGNTKVKDKTSANVLGKNVLRVKEAELKITVNKTKLAPVQEINTLPNKEVEQSSNTQHTSERDTEDFRQVLHQLKHVATEDRETTDSAEPDSETYLHPKQTRLDIQTPIAQRTVKDITINNNNNNKQNTSEESHISDIHNTKVLNKNTSLSVKTPELEDLADENGNVRKDGIFEVSETKHFVGKSRFAEKGNTSPKVKRKLSIPDNKVSEMSSLQSSALRKKIQVTSTFDFEKSSDFEQSLTLSTSKLTIQENATPEKLMSSPSSQEMLSPQHISAIELQQQLLNIDTRLTELELKGRDLENSIRKVNNLDEDDDTLMIEWFTLVNEKNDLVRKEADLIYISKEQELEDEQEQIESQLHYLMTKPDECKSPEEKEEEDYLIGRKIALVEQRNIIIDSMDEDRIRYEAEDKNIEVTLKDKGYWKDSSGTLKALKGKKVANSMFYT